MIQRARATRALGLVVALGPATAAANAQTIIDMPAPPADVTAITEGGTGVELGEVALHRYRHARVFPAYTYMSPPVNWSYWPYWSGWRVGIPLGVGWGYGWGRPWGYGWGRPWGWGYGFRDPCFGGYRFRVSGSRW